MEQLLASFSHVYPVVLDSLTVWIGSLPTFATTAEFGVLGFLGLLGMTGGGMGRSGIAGILPLVIALIAIAVMISVTPIVFNSISDAATVYGTGDLYLDFVTGTTYQGVSTAGIITCGDSTPANNALVCGDGKWTAFNEVLDLLPYMVAASVIFVAALYGRAVFTGGNATGLGAALAASIIGGAITLVISLVLIVVVEGLLVNVVQSAITNGFYNVVAIIKLTPTMMLVGIFGIALISTSISGYTGGSGKMMTAAAAK